MNAIVNSLPYISTILVICVMIGGFFAMRQGYSKQANDIQDRVIAALKMQNEVQARQIAACEKEITHLKQIVITIQYALKRRGLRIEIDDEESITIIDTHANRTHTVQMRASDTGDLLEIDDDKGKKEEKKP